MAINPTPQSRRRRRLTLPISRAPGPDQAAQWEEWLIVTSVVHDPEYLQIDWITDVNFLPEPDGSKWDPQPCSARW
jgi:hypothetical protein